MGRCSVLKYLFLGAIAAVSCTASAVRVNDDGLGQALIFPYYTTRDTNGNVFNTYITVVNEGAEAKALRVRFREGRNSREVASFNLFLSPNDVWAGAVQAPGPSQAAQVISTDKSCVSPAFDSTTPPSLTFTNAFYSGANADMDPATLDRTQEGFVEVIEMGTLDATAAAAVTHTAGGVPPNCAYVQGSPAIAADVPTGGLSGTLTLINVANGMDFSVNAIALADLFTAPLFRPASDPYPTFKVAEIDPSSVVVDGGNIYRSNWSRGVDAVSAVFMRKTWSAELVLDRPTNSNTDVVATFPTRQHYYEGSLTTEAATAPFSYSCTGSDQNFRGDSVETNYFNREESASPTYGQALTKCYASHVIDFTAAPPSNPPVLITRVLGSRNRGLIGGEINVASGSGWARFTKRDDTVPLTSLPTSTRINIRTGASTTGSHSYYGLPVVGFSVRTFQNGTLQCDAGACQGNYGGAFPLKSTRKIVTQ